MIHILATSSDYFGLIVAIVGLILTVITGVIIVAWNLGKMYGSIKSIGRTLDNFKEVVDKVVTTQDMHTKQLVKLEVKAGIDTSKVK